MMIFDQQLQTIADSEFRRQSSKGTVLSKHHKVRQGRLRCIPRLARFVFKIRRKTK